MVETASGQATVAGEARWFWFDWAPDGKRLALAHKEMVTIRHLDPAVRVEIPWIAGQTTWSRDGAYLASVVENYGPNAVGTTLMAVRVGSSDQPKALADTLRFVDWAPDSRQIAYISNGCAWKEYDLYTVRVDTGEKRRLTNSPQQMKHWPKWSPKGDVIGYSSAERLMLVDVSTGKERVLMQMSSEPRLFGWSPDGRYLAFGLYKQGALGCKDE